MGHAGRVATVAEEGDVDCRGVVADADRNVGREHCVCWGRACASETEMGMDRTARRNKRLSRSKENHCTSGVTRTVTGRRETVSVDVSGRSSRLLTEDIVVRATMVRTATGVLAAAGSARRIATHKRSRV